MKSGAIKIVTEDGHGISDNPSPLERQEEGQTLRSTIQIGSNHRQTTLGDLTVENGDISATAFTEGTVLREERVEVKTRRIGGDGRLEVDSEGAEVQVAETPFIHIEGEVLLTARTEAESARKIVETLSSSTIRDATVDVDGFMDSHPEADPVLGWGRNQDDEISAICAVGDIPADKEIQRRFDRSQPAQKSFENLEWNDRTIYGTITESGYVEIYRDENGGNIGTSEFARFVVEEVLEHAKIAG
jgi:hypothetical protein